MLCSSRGAAAASDVLRGKGPSEEGGGGALYLPKVGCLPILMAAGLLLVGVAST